MGTSDILGIGLSGSMVAKQALTTTGHNIANAHTKGFSRQRVQTDTRIPQLSGVGALGTGVKITEVKRMHDDFITSELRSNSSISNGLQMNYDFTSQIDNMLADPDAGLAPTIQSFFSSINNVANDPASQSSRQVMIGEANALDERFSYLNSRFESLRDGANQTLKTHIKDVNNLAKAIGDVNEKIVLSKEMTQGEPNDLLDQRERLLHSLSEKVSVTTTFQEDGAMNVFVGNGQTLVVGKRASSLGLKANLHDPSELEIVYKNLGTDSIVTKFMKGGTIGGLLDFRENMLNEGQNELGRIAIGISKSFNDQHHKGMALNNKLGGDFFKNINETAPASLASKDNSGDYEIKTVISNSDNLTTSDYLLNYNAGKYTLIRERDDKVIESFSTIPHEVKSEGLTISLLRGIKIENGDSFKIQPTRSASKVFKVDIENANEIAAAAPVRIRTSVHNMGNATPRLTNIADVNTPSFTAMNKLLSPSITVRFIDDNHIELLDDKGKVIKAQQLNEQNKMIPATPGTLAATPAIPGERGSPATPAIPAKPASRTETVASLSGVEHESEESKHPTNLETGIFYDPEVGLNLFPTPGGMNTGYSVQISGDAKAGDTFLIEYNTDAVGSNRNALELGGLQERGTLNNGTSNYNEVYSQLVSRVGSKTHELDVNRQAQGVLYEQAIAQRESVSGVNLDEEAADLVRYQQHYQANAKVIAAASEMFDTLIGVLGR